jgi:hypothetical protein
VCSPGAREQTGSSVHLARGQGRLARDTSRAPGTPVFGGFEVAAFLCDTPTCPAPPARASDACWATATPTARRKQKRGRYGFHHEPRNGLVVGAAIWLFLAKVAGCRLILTRRLCCPPPVSRASCGTLFTFARFPKSQRKSIRTSTAIVVRQAHHEGLHEEIKRPIKTQTVLPPEHIEGGGNRRDVVLGFAGVRADNHPQDRRLAKPRRKAVRSDH